LAEKIEIMLEAVESFYKNQKVGACVESHVTCNVSKIPRSLAFDAIYGKENKKREMLLAHKLIHDNMNDVLSSL
jgi:hypothetical protein